MGSYMLLAVTNHITQNVAVGAVPVDPAAHALPADLHPLLRGQRLVPAPHLPVDARGGAGRHGVDARRSQADARAGDPGRRLLRRPVRRLHVLPRRACAPQARAALPHPLLPDDLAGRRASARCSSASSRRWCSPPTSSSRPASSSARCCCCGRCGETRRSTACWAWPATAVAVGCAIWGVTDFYANTIVTSRNFYGMLRVQELGDDDANRRRSLVHGTIMHGTQYLGPEVSAAADDLLHRDLRHRPPARVDASADGPDRASA